MHFDSKKRAAKSNASQSPEIPSGPGPVSAFESVFSDAAIPMFIASSSSTIYYANCALRDLLGVPEDEWPIDNLATHFTRDPMTLPGKKERIRGQYCGLRRGDGESVDVEIWQTPVLFHGRHAWLCIVLEDAERLAAEKKLMNVEIQFHQLANSIDQVFWFTELDPERVLYVSPAFEQIWGRALSELYQDPRVWTHNIHVADRERVSEAFEAWVSGKADAFDIEYRIVTAEGEVRWIADHGALLKDEAGKIRWVSGIAKDITTRKRAEREKAQLESRLRQTEKLESLGVLTGGIAHDFNNLLTGLLGNVSLALMKLPEGSPARQHIENVQAATHHASDLCRQMLAYAGKARFVTQKIELQKLFDEVEALLRISMPGNVNLKLDCDRGLPPVHGDPTQVRQVLLNLAMNSADAIGKEAGIVTVRAGKRQFGRAELKSCYLGDVLSPGELVFLEVKDTGKGMDPATLARIFDPFFSTKFVGRGLGLASVLGIVRGHGGDILVQSEPGGGSVFRVVFPIRAKGWMSDRHSNN